MEHHRPREQDVFDHFDCLISQLYGGLPQQCRLDTIAAGLLHQAYVRPATIAVRDKTGIMTYGELAKHAIFLARQLRKFGMKPSHNIAIMAPRSIEFVVGALAVLVAGGRYLALNEDDVPTMPFQSALRDCTDGTPLLSTRTMLQRVGQISQLSECCSVVIIEDQMEKSLGLRRPNPLINLPGSSDWSEGNSASSTKAESMSDVEKDVDSIQRPDARTEDGPPKCHVPAKYGPRWLRLVRFRAMIVYRTIFSFVWLGNLAALVFVLSLGPDLIWLGRIAYINLTVGIVFRQDHVVNFLYRTSCSVPRTWPLWVRCRAAKIYHFGGIHSGTATAAVGWYIASLVVMTLARFSNVPPGQQQASDVTLVLSWLTIVLLLVIVGCAYATFRKAHHDKFEIAHRFFGWTSLALIWASTVLSVRDTRQYQVAQGASPPSIVLMVAQSPKFWLTAIITCSIALSWTTLRNVQVDSEVLSAHAVRLPFDESVWGVPVNGSFVRLSHRPLLEWHSFAPIGAPEPVDGYPRGFSLVVSNAGDWTQNMIDRPRSKIWVRGVPTCGVMHVAKLFNSIVMISTGSGIGPQLGFIQRPSCRFRLVWSTRDPKKTYGTRMCNAIKKCDPNAVIWSTSESGRPDLVQMGFEQYKNINAEAVIIIANEKITKKVVYGLESRGVPAFGAIWDS